MEIKELTIDRLIAGGDGIGYIDGKAHFVPQVLPGERVEVKIIEVKKGFNRCLLINVLESSDKRIEPFCKNYTQCGGCSFQFTSYNNQILEKKAIIQNIFKWNGKIELPDFDMIESKELKYRNRVQFHSSGRKLGFKKRNSDDIVSIDHCPILVDGLNAYLENPTVIGESRTTLFSENNNYSIGGVDTSSVVKIKNKDIEFNPGGFFQSNLSLVPGLLDDINSYINGTSVMDLYCGVGLFSSFLPSSVTQIIAVEIDKKVEPFIKNNIGDRNYKFYPMSLEGYIKRKLNKKNRVDTIIVDPPRKGLSPAVREFIKNSGVKRVIYVSCDPVTMARDISDLNKKGYNLNFYKAYDFYPHTFHIESLGILDLE